MDPPKIETDEIKNELDLNNEQVEPDEEIKENQN
tara:strand:+ start:65 stop:166 length:102 start_codon:yes stop_codon:yes gene_type:complete